MHLESEGKPSEEVGNLLEADAAARAYPDQVGVQPCPLQSKPEELPPLRALLWHIRELGGGFQTPSVRPGFCMESYAGVIKAVQADICILLGVTRTSGWVPELNGNVVTMKEEPRDTGIAEARRLLGELQRVDAGGGWQISFAKDAADTAGAPAYHLHQTACFLYKSAKGLSCGAVTVVPRDRLFLAYAPLQVPGSFDAPASLPLLAPMSVGRHTFSRTETVPEPNGELPEAGLVAFSAAGSVPADDAYFEFRTACDVEYQQPLQRGTVLRVPWWETVATDGDTLLENHMALNPSEVLLQDAAMHWEALPAAVHPDALMEVFGQLSDSLLTRGRAAGTAPRTEGMRIVDLIRAALPADTLAKVGVADSLDEDGAIAAQCKTYLSGVNKADKQAADQGTGDTAQDVQDSPASATPEDELKRQIAQAVLFARMLSDHWPIVADVRKAR